MSGTTDTAAPTAPQAPATPEATLLKGVSPVAMTASLPVDSLRGPQFVVACMGMVLIGFVTFMVFWKGSDALINTIGGLEVGSVLSAVLGFYFQSSVSSQRKDTPPPVLPSVQPIQPVPQVTP